ncbi:MAG: carbamate kinase [Gemmatimonadota bacterium]
MTNQGERSVVVAIGGNALSPSGEAATIANQFRHTRSSLAPIVEFACDGWKIAVVHGNGPQVGDELYRNEVARGVVEPLPLGVLVAETAGWIGYMIQQSLENALSRAGCPRRVVTLITQVRVDPDHPSMVEPTKFIGRALDPATADDLRSAGLHVETDTRGDLRRRVPSPIPLEIVESRMVGELVSRGDIVVAAGGGGIPVYTDARLGLEGVDAVIDKDRAAALLAREIGAHILLILTDVDAVYAGFGTPEAKKLDRLTASEAESLIASDDLGAGSMRPKLEAAVQFVRGGGGRAVIAALDEGPAALDGRAGTSVVSDGGAE